MFDITTIPIEVWAYIGIVIGIAARTIIPYMQTLQEDPTTVFQWRYVYTALIGGVFTGIMMMPLFEIPEAQPWQVLALAAFFAYETNNIANRRVEKYAPVRFATKEERIRREIDRLTKKLPEKVENDGTAKP